MAKKEKRETPLNTALEACLQSRFPRDIMFVGKRHGSKWDSGMPDLEGTYKGLAFYIECKRLLPDNRKTVLERFRIESRDGFKNGVTKKQQQNLLAVAEAGAGSFLCYYRHFGKKADKGLYLFPSKILINHTEKLIDFTSLNPKFNWEQYFVSLEVGTNWDIKKLFSKLMENIWRRSLVSWKK